MSIGVSIKKNLVAQVMDALEAAKIDHDIWNVSDWMDASFDGDIDIECTNRYKEEEFKAVVQPFLNQDIHTGTIRPF